jgi:hypothetical protein
MDDADFERERARIEAIDDLVGLNREIDGFSQRWQLDGAAHGALIGFAVMHAIEKDWVPKGRKEYKAYCKTVWHYGVSRINHFRRMAKGWTATRRAQVLLLANRDILGEDVKLPEIGSVAFANKAVKFAEAHDKALELGLDEGEAVATAEQVLKPKPRTSTDNPLALRYNMLLAILAVVCAERLELEQEVLEPLVGSIDLKSMDAINEWLKSGITSDNLREFHKAHHNWLLSELEPWWDDPPPPAAKPKHEPETGPHNAPEPVDPPTLRKMFREMSPLEQREAIRARKAKKPADDQPRPKPEPPIYKAIDQAISEIYTMKERTCTKVAEVLRRLPIHERDEDTRRRVADELWEASDPALWDDADRVSLAEACFVFSPTIIMVFATDTEVLQLGGDGALRIVTWEDKAAMVAPHIAEQRKAREERQRQEAGKAILRSKLPKVRKLKAMHERIDRVLELNPSINDQDRQAIDHIRAMTTDDPDFARCVTFNDYLDHAMKNIARGQAPNT